MSINSTEVWTLGQVRALTAAPKREKKISERVFVQGHEVPELAGSFSFPDGENEVSCYTDRADDVVDSALGPLNGFIMQIAANTDEIDVNDAVETLLALEIAARKRLDDFLKAFEDNIGLPCVRRVSGSNRRTGYSYRDPVAVEFLKWGEVGS